MKSDLSNTQTKHVMQSIQQELTEGKKAEAVRLFMEAQSKHLLPGDGDTLQWLVEKIGKDSTNKLLYALVHYPCFYCKKGLQPCEACNGVGHFDHEMICDQCLYSPFIESKDEADKRKSYRGVEKECTFDNSHS